VPQGAHLAAHDARGEPRARAGHRAHLAPRGHGGARAHRRRAHGEVLPRRALRPRRAHQVLNELIPFGPLYRFPWDGFSPIVLVTDESTVKRHPEYEAAKTGDVPSAKRLAAELTHQRTLDEIRRLLAGRRAFLVPVHAVEDQGYKRIPGAFSELLAERLDLEVEIRVIQANVVNHTGASGWQRMVRPAVFDGPVGTNVDYFMVDGFVGQGGTLANLRGFLMQCGGRVLGAVTLTGRADPATLALQAGTLAALREKHGEEIENWWQGTFGYRFDCLTESEARYLVRVEDADTIRARLTAAGSEEHH